MHVRNDINVTPLVDVMLVLLIIFMLMTLIMGRGHDVQLPKATELLAGEGQDAAGRHRSTSTATSSSRRTSSARSTSRRSRRWPNQIEAAWKAPKNPDGVGRIYLKADNKVEYGKVYPVLEYLNKEHGDAAGRSRDRQGQRSK